MWYVTYISTKPLQKWIWMTHFIREIEDKILEVFK